jgi:major type 1 subunit fimbrin (pilin)
MANTFRLASVAQAALAISAAALSAPSFAGDGTINFVGNVVNNTCAVSVGSTTMGGSNKNSVTVTLPDAKTSSLDAAGEYDGLTKFKIGVSGCDTSAEGLNGVPGVNSFQAFFTTTFAPNAGTVDSNGRLLNATELSPAQNVVLEVGKCKTSACAEADLTSINLNGTDAEVQQNVTDASIEIENASTGAEQYFAVRYYATAKAKAGGITASLPFTISYK